jgi:hypothetical protein
MSVNAISLKVAWRNILRQRWYSLIHVLGLAIGICVCIVIYLIGRYELSFDNFHPDANRIYRIVGDVQDKDGNVIFLNSPFREVAGIEHLIGGFETKAAFHVFGSTISVPSANGPVMKIYGNRQEGSYALATILTGPDCGEEHLPTSGLGYRAHHFYQLSGPPGSGHLCYQPADEGDWYSEGHWGYCHEPDLFALAGFPQADRPCDPYCRSDFVVGRSEMVGEFCVQDIA